MKNFGKIIFAAVVAVSQAHAVTVTIDLDFVYTGATPAGSSPWARAVFDDAAAGLDSGKVRLTLLTLMSDADEFVKEWRFNFNPALDSADLTFTPVDVSAISPGSATVSAGNNSFENGVAGVGSFDILFEFPTENGTRFTGSEAVIFDISYSGGSIGALDFNFGTADGLNYFSSVKIQAIGDNAQDSGKIAAATSTTTSVPVGGSTAALLCLGLLGTAGLRRKLG